MKRSELIIGLHVAQKVGKGFKYESFSNIFDYKRVEVLAIEPYAHKDFRGPLPTGSGQGVYVQPLDDDGTPNGKPIVVQLGRLVGIYPDVHAKQQALREEAQRQKDESSRMFLSAMAAGTEEIRRIRSVLPSTRSPLGMRVDTVTINTDELADFLDKHGLLPPKEARG